MSTKKNFQKIIPDLLKNEQELITIEKLLNNQKKFNSKTLEKIFKKKIEHYQEVAFNTYLKEVKKAEEYGNIVIDLFSNQWWNIYKDKKIHIVKYYTYLNNYELKNGKKDWGLGIIELSFTKKSPQDKKEAVNKKIHIEELLKSDGEISKGIRDSCRKLIKEQKKYDKQIERKKLLKRISIQKNTLENLLKNYKIIDKEKNEEIFKVIEDLNNLVNDLNN